MAEPTPPVRPRRRRSHAGHRGARRQQALAAAVAVVTALSLLTLAVPRTMALVETRPAGRTLEQLRQQRSVDQAALDAAIEAGLAASAWLDSGMLWQQIAAAHLGRLQVATDRQARLDALLQAEAALQRALARQPGDAVAWWRLARVANMLQRPAEQVAAALHLSVVTGGRVASLLFPRLRLALASWSRLDDAAREAFTAQLVWAMSRDPQAFIILVRRSLAEEHVRAAFRGQRELLEAYQSLIDRSRPLPGAQQG